MKTIQTKTLRPSTSPPPLKTRRLVRYIRFHLKLAALSCVGVGGVLQAQAFSSVMQLSSLDGSSGFSGH